MLIHLNVFNAVMLDKIVGDVNGCLVITKQIHFRARSNANLREQPSKPKKLTKTLSHSSKFSFSAG
jgi:hypothetical protein